MNTKTITFRPVMDTEQLRLVATHQKYKDLTEFINAAIREKVQKDIEDPEARQFISKVSEAAYEYMGWKFRKPSNAESLEIRKGVREMKEGKVKTVSSDRLLKRLKKF
jgi:tetrahydromethanopterin S-methyltransferase subunit A